MALYLTDENGVPHKVASGGNGMENPMTAAGDLIVGGASGSPTRLPMGNVGDVLKVGANGLEYGAGGGTSAGLKLVTEVVLSSATQEITLSGLDINNDGGFYMMIFQNVSKTSAEGANRIQFNGITSGYNQIGMQSTSLINDASAGVTPSGWHGKNDGWIDMGQNYNSGNVTVSYITLVNNCVSCIVTGGSVGSAGGYIQCVLNYGSLTGQNNITSIKITTNAANGYKAGTKIKLLKVGA